MRISELNLFFFFFDAPLWALMRVLLPGCNGLRCFWQHLKYGILHFSHPFTFSENVVGASVSFILLLSVASKKKIWKNYQQNC